jgi:pyruvate/2-oxoglutarate dehydrogenase complex dihydrolipoamide dehydrogenase (E3) component
LLVDKFPLLANNHAKAIDDAEGIVKVMADKETNKVLGVHIMVSNAGEIIHEAMLTLQYGASSEDVFCSMSHNHQSGGGLFILTTLCCAINKFGFTYLISSTIS